MSSKHCTPFAEGLREHIDQRQQQEDQRKTPAPTLIKQPFDDRRFLRAALRSCRGRAPDLRLRVPAMAIR